MATKKIEEEKKSNKKTPNKEVKTSKKVEKLNDNHEKEQNPIISIIELLLIIAFVVIVLVFFPNTVIWNITALLLMLSILIFVHEGGHFIIGKKCGVHIYEFALGMGPKVLGFRRKNDPTEYTLRAFPIGGYCAMAGEEGEDDANLAKDKFMCNKPKLQRVAILVAGVTMNFITAILLLFFISLVWGNTQQESIIGKVEKDSPAAQANIQAGDKVIGLNGYNIDTWDRIAIVSLLKNKNDYFEYKIEHPDGKVETIKIVPNEYVTIDDKREYITDDNTLSDIAKKYHKKESDLTVNKYIGISQSTKRYHGVWNAIKYAFKKFVTVVDTMLLTIGSLFTGKLGLSALSGPVGMYSVVGQVAKYGFANMLFLTAYLSINLGVMNILPFPAFDGGRVLFVIIEAITRKKVDSRVENWFHTIGFILLMILMLVITCKDVINIFN